MADNDDEQTMRAAIDAAETPEAQVRAVLDYLAAMAEAGQLRNIAVVADLAQQSSDEFVVVAAGAMDDEELGRMMRAAGRHLQYGDQTAPDDVADLVVTVESDDKGFGSDN